MKNITKSIFSDIDFAKNDDISTYERRQLSALKTKCRAKSTKQGIKEIRDWAIRNLFKKVRCRDDSRRKTTLFAEMFSVLEELARKGDLKAMEMLFNYSGLKPIDERTTELIAKNTQIKRIYVDTEKLQQADNLIDNAING